MPLVERTCENADAIGLAVRHHVLQGTPVQQRKLDLVGGDGDLGVLPQ
jgi:hypothetical protein